MLKYQQTAEILHGEHVRCTPALHTPAQVTALCHSDALIAGRERWSRYKRETATAGHLFERAFSRPRRAFFQLSRLGRTFEANATDK